MRADPRGANLFEYILVACLVALGAISTVSLFGGRISELFGGNRAAALDGPSDDPDSGGPPRETRDLQGESDFPRLKPIGLPSAEKILEIFQRWFPDPRAKLAPTRDLLETIPTGRDALKELDAAGVTYRFAFHSGTFYVIERNTITIDSAHDVEELVVILVHEANHVRADRAGKGVRPDRWPSRESYVAGILAEEADGIALEAHAYTELTNAGHHPPLRGEVRIYLEAYNEARQRAGSTNRKDDAEVERVARQAGRDRLLEAMQNGKLRSSRDGRRPAEVYGQQWDRAHARRWPF